MLHFIFINAPMKYKYLLLLLTLSTVYSCGKESAKSDTYIVSANKIITLTKSNWNNLEGELSNKKDYQYKTVPSDPVFKAVVYLPAIDDSNRTVKGNVLLNISHDNTVINARFDSDTLSQTLAFAMMLNYHRLTLQRITGIRFSIGQLLENGAGSNPSVNVILSKLSSGQSSDQLGISYECDQGRFAMIVFRQNNGSYIFSYRGG
jgi:hypothetical protein